MKKHVSVYLTLLLFIASNGFVNAQTESEPPKSPKEKVTSHFSTTFNLYTSQWLDAPKGITVKPVSPGYSIYVHYKLPLYDPYIVFMIGAGVAYTDFRFNGKVFYTEDLDSTYFEQLQPAEYKKNKLSLVHVEAPVELRFALPSKKPGKGVFIAPGFVAGLLANDYIKTVSEDNKGNATKQKIYYTRNLAKYNYGVSMRLGYGLVGLYGYYGLSPLFEDGKGPGTTFYKVGLTLGGQ